MIDFVRDPAEAIVDITTTGSTLRANHLKVLSDGVILESQACLVTSKKARSAEDEATFKSIVDAVAAASTLRTTGIG